MTILTRNTYAQHCTEPGVHRRYYAQFVTQATIDRVVHGIGAYALRASKDPNFNDIQLKYWDIVAAFLPMAMRFGDAGDMESLSGAVCVAKEAARQWVDAQAQVQP